MVNPSSPLSFFPRRRRAERKALFERALPRLASANPDFFSVTYGAGGSTHDQTLKVVEHVQRQYGITGMAHLTCISSSRTQIEQYLDDARRLGIRNILALRGDPPRDDADSVNCDNGFDYSYQLVDFIKAAGDFSIGAAGFPEKHVACTDDKYVDWQRVKNKIDHGAEFVLTQLFFENADYFEFVEYLVDTLGVTAPIAPGILPILSTDQVKRFTAICGARLPARLERQLDALGDDPEAIRAFGVEYATRQCENLLQRGAPGLHLYSLNRSPSCLEILKNLGLS